MEKRKPKTKKKKKSNWGTFKGNLDCCGTYDKVGKISFPIVFGDSSEYDHLGKP